MFYVEWCAETNRFVGKCNLHPLFQFYADSTEGAMTGIRLLSEGLDLDNEATDVDLQYEDTDVAEETTNVHWPPFLRTL